MVTTQERKIILFDIDYTLFDTDKYKSSDLTDFVLYPEVIFVLEQLKEIADFGIFSEGELNFQKAKLVKTAIKNHFADEHVYIVSKKLENIENIFQKYHKKKLYLVDDRLEVLHNVSAFSSSVFTIWVNRGPYAEKQKQIEGFVPNAIVSSLIDIVEIIKYK